MTATTAHPAKFSDALLPHIAEWLEGAGQDPVLDPMAGVGKLAEIVPYAFLNEMEEEWAAECRKYPHATVTVGDARHLPYDDGFFTAIATSPTYGNRMADHHNAAEKCRPCGGGGWVIDPCPRDTDGDGCCWVRNCALLRKRTCEKCAGAGCRQYKRNTYRHQLGRELTPGNTGMSRWGQEYRDLHRAIYTECRRVLQPGGLFALNVSNHIRAGVEVNVSDWHYAALRHLGFGLVEHRQIKTPRNRQGQNHEARVDHENLFLFEKKGQ